jgi:RecB family exonuclease
MSFLHEIAREVYAVHGKEMHRVTVVFPSRRAAVFFRKALQEVLPGPAFAPQTLTLNDFVYAKSGLQAADPVRLLFALYQVYQELMPEHDEGFASFSSWGSSLLRDFAEVDNYLLDGDAVFHFLNQEKAIELWQPDRGALSEYEQRYLDFYRSLGSLYHRFREKLNDQGKVYPALATRLLTEKWAAAAPQLEEEQIWFCGFNALNTAEITLIKQLLQEKKAQVRWDSDCFYLDHDQHEAGLFLRRMLEDEQLAGAHTPPDRFSAPKQIKLLQAAGQLAQVKAASEQLTVWQQQDPDLLQTVLVLADESLLVPMLNSLPPQLQLNVTMGYPARLGQANTLVALLLRLMQNRTIDANGPVYYHRDLLPLLALPLLRTEAFSAFNKVMIESGRVRIPYALLEETSGDFPEIAAILGNSALSPLEFPALVVPLLEKLADKRGNDFLQQQISLQLVTLLRRMDALLQEEALQLDWKILRQLWHQLSASETLDFLGEPLEGLQLMGLLETRALDFKRVLVVGVNEGKLPGKASPQSFITSTLRFNFQLPGNREKEAVFAYHFYRLLQGAEDIVLTYNGVQDDFGGGEPSRYIQQLRFELNQLPNIQLSEMSVSPAFRADRLMAQTIKIPKNEALQAKIEARLARGISPSSMSQYIACKLKFYFSQLEGLQEEDEISEQLDFRSIGTVLHRTLELLYQPYLRQPLQTAHLDAMKLALSGCFEQALKETMQYAPTDQGLNLLIREVCRDYLERFLKQEKNLIEEFASTGAVLEVLESELKLAFNFELNGHSVGIKGIADRVDRLQGQLRITDYKTGKFTPTEITVATIHEDLRDPDKIKALQLLTYAWLYWKNFPETTSIASGIWSFRAMKDGLQPAAVAGQTLLDADILNAHGLFLETLLSEMLDPATIFDQTTDEKICEKCNFRQICQR